VLPCFIRLSCACHALPSFVKVRAKQIMEISLGRWHGPAKYRTKQGIQNPLHRIGQIREKCQKGPKNKSLKWPPEEFRFTPCRSMQCVAKVGVRIGGSFHLVILLSDAPPSHRLLSRLPSSFNDCQEICQGMSEILSRTHARALSVYLSIWSNLSILSNLILPYLIWSNLILSDLSISCLSIYLI